VLSPECNSPDRPSDTIASLLGQLARELSQWVRQEIALARAELEVLVSVFMRGAVLIACAGAALFAGFLLLLLSSVLTLSKFMPVWMAALAVGFATALLGSILLVLGRKRLDLTTLVPQHSLRSLRRDKDVLIRKRV